MKICVISDTHNLHKDIIFNHNVEIDTIIHCGDFTSSVIYNKEQTLDFLDWFNNLPIKNKILVAGNHDGFLYSLYQNNEIFDFISNNYPNIIYLQDNSVIIDGIKFYGTPWTLKYSDWDFMKINENELFKVFSLIDKDTNVLISHSPAETILDYSSGKILGSSSLKYQVERLQYLDYHLFGHIHNSYGYRDMKKYIAINSSFVKNHINNNNIIIFDYYTKEFF